MKKGLLLPAKAIIFSIAFILLNLFFASASFAAKRVTAVSYGTQTGAASAGTGTSVTYTITLTEAGASAPATDGITLTWTSGTPTGVTYAFSSATETPITGTTFTPSGTSGSTILLTVTTTGATPLGAYPFT